MITDATIAERIDGLDWQHARAAMDETGAALVGQVLDADECAAQIALYDEREPFRKTVDMARHRFGSGEYRYFDYPLVDRVAQLRAGFWPHVLDIARRWADHRGRPAPWPVDLSDWLEQCHAAGQVRPTPLMLRYGAGDWNALHRDLYGDMVFPLQVVIGLDRPGVDYDGGEFVVVEQRPRAQSRATIFVVPQGHAVVFTTRDRPMRTSSGWATAQLRHGVSTVHRGSRHALGLIFHDAE